MKLTGTAYFYIIIMALTVVVIVTSLRMEYFMSKLLPLIIGSIVFLLSAIGLVQEMLAGDKPEATVTDDETPGEAKAEDKLREYLPIGAWLGGFSLAIYLLGFVITIPLFVFAYMKSHGIGWLAAIIYATLITAFIYGTFELALGVTLYRGQLLPALY